MLIDYSRDGEKFDSDRLQKKGFKLHDNDFRKNKIRNNVGEFTGEYETVFNFVGFLVNNKNDVLFKGSAGSDPGHFKLMYKDENNHWHIAPVKFIGGHLLEKNFPPFVGGVIVPTVYNFNAIDDMPAGKSIEWEIVAFMLEKKDMNHLMLIYDGIIGGERGIAVCDVEQTIGFTGTLIGR